MLRAFYCLVVAMVAVSSGAVLGTRSRDGQLTRTASPGLVDVIIIALCWAGALLTYRLRIASALTLAIWLTVGLFASYFLHRLQSSIPGGERPQKESRGVSAGPRNNPNAPIATAETPKPWGRWRAFAAEVAGFQSRLILRAVYYFAFAPFGLLVGLLGDPLDIGGGAIASSWKPRESGSPTVEDGRRQF